MNSSNTEIVTVRLLLPKSDRAQVRLIIRQVFFLMLMVLLTISLKAQPIEESVQKAGKRLNENPVKITGGVQSFIGLNHIHGLGRRIDPFRWRLIGFANLDLLGVQIPTSLIFSTKSTVFNYTLPAFAFAGLSPRYKWAVLHLGDRNMNLGRYSLSGHSFRGVGLELSPGKFRLKAMYGRLRRARAEDLGSVQNIDPAYKRLGWAIQTGYEHGQDQLLFTLFKARDVANSIEEVMQNAHVRPAGNVVTSIHGQKTIADKLLVKLEIARSTLTNDLQTAPRSDISTFKDPTKGLLQPSLSTGSHTAIATMIHYQSSVGLFEIGHEWIDPGYYTMGALFFQNDVERFTGGWTHQLAKSIRLQGRVGWERNNLSNSEINDYDRLVGSLHINYAPSTSLNLSGHYNNFSSTNRLRSFNDPLSPIDTIILAQINRQASLQFNYRFDKTSTAGMSSFLTWQQANQIENELIQRDLTNKFLIGGLYFTSSSKPRGIFWRSGLNYQQTRSRKLAAVSLGPSCTINGKGLNGKLSYQGSISWLFSRVNQESAGSIRSLQSSVDYELIDNHRLGLQFFLVERKAQRSTIGDFRELRLTLQYGWTIP